MKINQLSKCAGMGVFFLFANMNAQSTEKVIKNFIQNDVSFRNNTGAEFKILNQDHSASLKSNIVNVQQYFGKTPIYKSLAKAVIQDGRIVSFNNNFNSDGQLKVTATNMCGTGPARTHTISRNVPALPGVISGPTAVCNGSTTTYAIAAVPNATSYTWAVPSGAIVQSGQGTTAIHVLWASTSGNVKVFSSNACGNSGFRSKGVNVNCRVAENAVAQFNAEAFPNPAKGNINVNFNSNEETEFIISIMDITGRTLLSENYNAVSGINLRSFDLSRFEKGIYMLRLQSEDGGELLRIAVE